MLGRGAQQPQIEPCWCVGVSPWQELCAASHRTRWVGSSSARCQERTAGVPISHLHAWPGCRKRKSGLLRVSCSSTSRAGAMNRAPSVFRAPWKVSSATCALRSPRPWAFTTSLPVFHGNRNPINDNVEAQRPSGPRSQAPAQRSVGSRFLGSQAARLPPLPPLLPPPLPLWMLIDSAAGGWSQCSQKMTATPEMMHSGSDFLPW